MKEIELLINELKENDNKHDDFIKKTYGLVEKEFGKKITYRGIDYIVMGLEIEKNEEKKWVLCDVEVKVSFSMMLVLRSSFFDEIKIPAEQYIQFKGLK